MDRRSFLKVLIAVPIAGIVAAKMTPTAASPTKGWTAFKALKWDGSMILPSEYAPMGQIFFCGDLVVSNARSFHTLHGTL